MTRTSGSSSRCDFDLNLRTLKEKSNLRYQSGKSFAEITKFLSEKHDGKSIGGSTVRMRWNRFIEPNMSSVKEQDHEKLMEAVLSTDASIAKQKHDLDAKRWAMVGEAMIALGAEQYPVGILSLTYDGGH